jgi:hypothetical protein
MNEPTVRRSRIENATNEPTGHWIESRKRAERTHRLQVKHPRTQRPNPSAVESNVENSQNRTLQVGSDASFAKRSQFRPNRMLSHELSTVLAYQVWSSLASAVGSCGTGQPASERSAECSRPSAGGTCERTEEKATCRETRQTNPQVPGPRVGNGTQRNKPSAVGLTVESSKVEHRHLSRLEFCETKPTLP